jgi:hypothetical protein
MSDQKLFSIRQVIEQVPNADASWLRLQISVGAVKSRRIGYHILVPESELRIITDLAAVRRQSRGK